MHGVLSSPMKLLIVEDEVRLADLLRKGLTEEGHTVTCAADGAEALALAKAYEFDVIVLDVMIPRMSGYDVAKRLRADKVPTPILMLTARGDAEDRIAGLERGADDYLAKPFEPRELMLRLNALLRRTRVAQPPANRIFASCVPWGWLSSLRMRW